MTRAWGGSHSDLSGGSSLNDIPPAIYDIRTTIAASGEMRNKMTPSKLPIYSAIRFIKYTIIVDNQSGYPDNCTLGTDRNPDS